jgi:hypothetical protein
MQSGSATTLSLLRRFMHVGGLRARVSSSKIEKAATYTAREEHFNVSQSHDKAAMYATDHILRCFLSGSMELATE